MRLIDKSRKGNRKENVVIISLIIIQVIRMRFTEKDIETLERIKWWDYDPDIL